MQGRVVVPCVLSSDDVNAELQTFLFSEHDFLVAGVVWASNATQGSAWCCGVAALVVCKSRHVDGVVWFGSGITSASRLKSRFFHGRVIGLVFCVVVCF